MPLNHTHCFNLQAGVRCFTRIRLPTGQLMMMTRTLVVKLRYADENPVNMYGFRNESDFFDEGKSRFYGTRPHFVRIKLKDIMSKAQFRYRAPAYYYLVFWSEVDCRQISVRANLDLGSREPAEPGSKISEVLEEDEVPVMEKLITTKVKEVREQLNDR